MKGIWVKQPFAGLLTARVITAAVQRFGTDYRGTVVICSTQKIYTGRMLHPHTCQPTPPQWFAEQYAICRLHGWALCTATLVDVKPFTAGLQKAACMELRTGGYVWVFENIEYLSPATFRVYFDEGLDLFEIDGANTLPK